MHDSHSLLKSSTTFWSSHSVALHRELTYRIKTLRLIIRYSHLLYQLLMNCFHYQYNLQYITFSIFPSTFITSTWVQNSNTTRVTDTSFISRVSISYKFSSTLYSLSWWIIAKIPSLLSRVTHPEISSSSSRNHIFWRSQDLSLSLLHAECL